MLEPKSGALFECCAWFELCQARCGWGWWWYVLRRGWLKDVKRKYEFCYMNCEELLIVKFGTGIILVFSILLVDPTYNYCWCFHYLLLLILCLWLIWPFWSPVVFVGHLNDLAKTTGCGISEWRWQLGSQVKLFKAFLASSKPKSGHLEDQPLVGGTALVPRHTGHCLAMFSIHFFGSLISSYFFEIGDLSMGVAENCWPINMAIFVVHGQPAFSGIDSFELR